jgi:GST-like protein
MITLYTWGTPNGRKVSIMLEECGLPYRVQAVDLGQGEQFAPAFVAVSPYGKIPALADDDGPDGAPITVFESGAILLYLAARTGRFLPADDRGKWEALQWLMFQMGGVGPMLGQANHFLHFAKEQVPYAMARYHGEAKRIYGVLDARLADRDFLAGDYGIADMATYPWIARHDFHHIELADYPSVRRWFDTISARPAVQRGMRVPA